MDQSVINSAQDPRLAAWLDEYAPDRAMAIVSVAERWLRGGGGLRIRANSLGLVAGRGARVVSARLVCRGTQSVEPILEFLPGRLRRSNAIPDDIEDFIDSLEAFGAQPDRSRSSWRVTLGADPRRQQLLLDALVGLWQRQ